MEQAKTYGIYYYVSALVYTWNKQTVNIFSFDAVKAVAANVCVCACTNFLSGACNSDPVLYSDLSCRISAGTCVFCKAQIIVRSQIHHIMQYTACLPARTREGGNQT